MTSPLFSIPPNVHLLITTPSRVLAWNSQGLGTVFKSSKRGIVAARGAGKGILAVADQHTVVLHDSKHISAHGVDRSWGLNADEGHVRHLEYSRSAGRLYLSTALTGDILDYSPERANRVQPVLQAHHASPPTAMAVSPTGQWMVSASGDPPAIYLKQLNLKDLPVLVQPTASEAAAHVATFHPERPNVFLLGFRDGTVAAYDVTKVLHRDGVAVQDGEIAHLSELHRATSKIVNRDGIGVKQTSVTAAAFLPGYRTRAISVGSDGRCKMFDFADGGFVLRTWHAKGPLASVTVMSIRHPSHERAVDSINALRRKRAGARQNRAYMGGPTSTDNIIAVGRLDGRVQIYDSVGLLLLQKIVSENSERVIALEWVNGPSPERLKDEPLKMPEVLDDTKEITPAARGRQTPSNLEGSLGNRDLEHRSPHRVNKKGPDIPARRFTIHPDEVGEPGTVLRSPQKNPGFEPATQYLDLFSAENPGRLMSKGRPRLSSKTFIKELDAKTTAQSQEVVRETASPSVAPILVVESAGIGQSRRRSTHVSPSEKMENCAEVERRGASSSAPGGAPNVQGVPGKTRLGVTLQSVEEAARKLRPSEPTALRKTHRHMHPSLKSPAIQKHWDPGNVLERESTWPTDSMQDQSLHTDGEDVWVTSESENEALVEHTQAKKQGLENRPLDQNRPPQEGTRSQALTQRAGFDQGRKSRFTEMDQDGVPLSTGLPIPHFDGSTDEDMFSAATHLSPDGTFSPSSNHVRDLFPRRSSLSRRKKSAEEKRQSKRSDKSQPLKYQAIDAVSKRQPYHVKGPWSRLKQERGQIQEAERGWDETVDGDGDPRVEMPCVGCAERDVQLQRLVDDREKLQAEVMMLRRLCQETVPLASRLHARAS